MQPISSDPLQLWDIHIDTSDEKGDGRIQLRTINNTDDNNDINHDTQNQVHGPLIQISGSRLSQNYIICPPKPTSSIQRPSLGITLPYLYLTVATPSQSQQQQYNPHFSFEVTILDDKQTRRRFRASTYQSTTVVTPDICTVPLKLETQPRRLDRDEVLLPAKKEKTNDDDTYFGREGNDGEDNSSEEHKFPCWNRLCIPLHDYTRLAYGTTYVETAWVQVHSTCNLKRLYFSSKEINEDDELPEEFRLYNCPRTKKT